MQPFLGPLDQASFTYRWRHPDPRMEELHRAVSACVAEAAQASDEPRKTFERVRRLAHAAAGRVSPGPAAGGRRRPRAPRLTESWFC